MSGYRHPGLAVASNRALGATMMPLYALISKACLALDSLDEMGGEGMLISIMHPRFDYLDEMGRRVC